MPRSRSGHGAKSALDALKAVSEGGSRQDVEAGAFAARTKSIILVVDDEPALRYAASRMLQQAGYRTLDCGTAAEALALVEGASAVLMDVNLPDTNGVAVCAQLKRQPATASIPVVLTSALLVKSMYTELGLRSGADAYLLAPIQPEELISTVDRLLGI